MDDLRKAAELLGLGPLDGSSLNRRRPAVEEEYARLAGTVRASYFDFNDALLRGRKYDGSKRLHA